MMKIKPKNSKLNITLLKSITCCKGYQWNRMPQGKWTQFYDTWYHSPGKTISLLYPPLHTRLLFAIMYKKKHFSALTKIADTVLLIFLTQKKKTKKFTLEEAPSKLPNWHIYCWHLLFISPFHFNPRKKWYVLTF